MSGLRGFGWSVAGLGPCGSGLALMLSLAACKADNSNKVPADNSIISLKSPDGIRKNKKEIEVCPNNMGNDIDQNISLRMLNESQLKRIFSEKDIKIKFYNRGMGSTETLQSDGNWMLTLYQDTMVNSRGKWYINSNEIVIESKNYDKICRHIFFGSDKMYYMEPISEATHDDFGRLLKISFSEISKYEN